MSAQHPSHKLDSFTDREQILDKFKQFLESAQPDQFHLLAIRGNPGTGKTFLIEYLFRRVCPEFAWQAGQLTFVQAIPDFRTILLGLEDAFKGCVPHERSYYYHNQPKRRG